MFRLGNMNSMVKTWFVALLTVMAVYGCGGGGSGGASPTGSVAILVTDGPSDYFDEIKLTITEIRLLGDDGQIVVFEGEETVDLLDLEHYSDLLAFKDDIPTGKYEKIRLFLSDIALIKKDEQGNITEEHHPRLPANGKIDLNPRGSFEIEPGMTTNIQIDIDADKAIHITLTGNKEEYRFRPVVFVDIINSIDTGKLIRHAGVIYSIDPDSGSFVVCESISLSSSGAYGDDCIKVYAGQASVFNDQGEAVSFDELAVDEPVIVYGTIAEYHDEEHEKSEDEPESSDDDSSTVTALSDHEEEADDSSDVKDEMEIELSINAILVAIGTADSFVKAEGSVAMDYDATTQSFDMSIDSNPHFTGDTISVVLDDATPIVTRSGELLDPASLVSGTKVQAKGVIMDGSDNTLKAILVIAEPVTEEVKISGLVSSIKEDLSGFTVTTSTGEACVDINEETDLYLINGTDSEEIAAGELQLDAVVEVYGKMTGGSCTNADDVLIFPSPSVAPQT